MIPNMFIFPSDIKAKAKINNFKKKLSVLLFYNLKASASAERSAKLFICNSEVSGRLTTRFFVATLCSASRCSLMCLLVQ